MRHDLVDLELGQHLLPARRLAAERVHSLNGDGPGADLADLMAEAA